MFQVSGLSGLNPGIIVFAPSIALELRDVSGLNCILDNPNSAFTHTLNNLRYYINCGIVVLICSAVLFIRPNLKSVLAAFLLTLPINIGLQVLFPNMNYFVRAFLVILSGLTFAFVGSKGALNSLFSLFQPANSMTKRLGWFLAISLFTLHIIFH